MEEEKKEVDGNELNNDVLKSKNPFDDPVQRRKCLIKFIRLRKQRAQEETAQRKALAQKKLDAKATLQNAEVELRRCERDMELTQGKLDELNTRKHELLTERKTIISREEQQKKQQQAAAAAAAAAAEALRQREAEQQKAALMQFNVNAAAALLHQQMLKAEQDKVLCHKTSSTKRDCSGNSTRDDGAAAGGTHWTHRCFCSAESCGRNHIRHITVQCC